MTPSIDVKTVPVVEIFGPTFQGEGPCAGRSADFIRLGGCNLTCFGCDTPWTWDGKRYDLRAEMTPMTAAQILAQLPRTGYPAEVVHSRQVPLVVITGGEPLLHQKNPALLDVVRELDVWRRPIHFETNGTLAPDEDLWKFPGVFFTVSPKLDGPMSADPEHKRVVDVALNELAGLARYDRACFKFVCSSPAHVDQAAELVDRFHIPPTAVWIMPEGNTPALVLTGGATIADTVLGHGFNMTTRLHVLLWPKEDRGR